MRGAVRFCVAWITRPVSTSPWIVFEAVREFAAIPFAWRLPMVVKPLIFTPPLIDETLRLVVLIVDAPSLTKFATALGWFVTILPPPVPLPRMSCEPALTTPRDSVTSELLKKLKLPLIEPVVIPLPPMKVDG